MNFVKDIDLGRISVITHTPILRSLDNDVRVTAQTYSFFSTNCDDWAGVGCDIVLCCIYLRAWVLYIDGSIFIITPQRIVLHRLVQLDRHSFIKNWRYYLSAVDEVQGEVHTVERRSFLAVV
jgi:hypothetical protein